MINRKYAQVTYNDQAVNVPSTKILESREEIIDADSRQAAEVEQHHHTFPEVIIA